MVLASAPAKIILFGEHFVVSDRLAIAAAIDLRAKVEANFNDSKFFSFLSKKNNFKIDVNFDDVVNGRINNYNSFFKPLLFILYEISKCLKLERGIDFIIDSDIPIGVGLGSSAAVSVAFSAATLKLLNYNFGMKDIIIFASKGESLAHERPSGIDPTISTLGGILVYRRSEGFRTLDVSINNPVIIGVTNESRSTAKMVMKVLNFKAKYPKIFDFLYEANDIIVYEAIEALKSNDLLKIGELMNIAHGLLSSIGVSSLSLERLIYAARNAGAYGAKITGAGGGGAMIAVCDSEKIGLVSKAIKDNGGSVISSYISNCGVKIHE
ncbi:MAG: mevalonate kinase [Candidatus Methanomethylicia archaeon]